MGVIMTVTDIDLAWFFWDWSLCRRAPNTTYLVRIKVDPITQRTPRV